MPKGLQIKSVGKPHLHLGKITQAIRPGLHKAMKRAERILAKQVSYNLSGHVLQTRSGLLKRSFESAVEPTAAGWKLEAGFDLDRVPYARIHELGGMAGRNRSTRIPKRPYLRRALAEKKVGIRKEMADFVGRLIK